MSQIEEEQLDLIKKTLLEARNTLVNNGMVLIVRKSKENSVHFRHDFDDCMYDISNLEDGESFHFLSNEYSPPINVQDLKIAELNKGGK